MKFLLELRQLVGAEVFSSFLQDYLTRNTNKLATLDDFFTILSEHSDADWSRLKANYFRNP
jgi:aminopeptidase N